MIKYYQLTLDGYGGDSAYIKLTKEAYDYWYKRQKEIGDPLLDYVVDSHDIMSFGNVPSEADFLLPNDAWESCNYRNEWKHCKSIISKQTGIDYRCCTIEINEIPPPSSEANYSLPIIESIALQDFVQDYDIINKNHVEDVEAHYMLQVYDSFKGRFFSTVIETQSKFDSKLLYFNLQEYYNGDYIVESIHYDKQLLQTLQPNIDFRGTSVAIWKSR